MCIIKKNKADDKKKHTQSLKKDNTVRGSRINLTTKWLTSSHPGVDNVALNISPPPDPSLPPPPQPHPPPPAHTHTVI